MAATHLLLRNARDGRRSKTDRPQLSALVGGFWRLEVDGSRCYWRPHIHLVGLAVGPLDPIKLGAEWAKAGGDPVVHVESGPAGGRIDRASRPIRYALKSWDKEHAEQRYELHCGLYKKRLTESFGLVRSFKVSRKGT